MGWLEIIYTSFFAYLLIVAGSTVMGFIPVWLLWNWLLPNIFSLPEISIYQSAGLVALISCLFGALNSWEKAESSAY